MTGIVESNDSSVLVRLNRLGETIELSNQRKQSIQMELAGLNITLQSSPERLSCLCDLPEITGTVSLLFERTNEGYVFCDSVLRSSAGDKSPPNNLEELLYDLRVAMNGRL